MATKITGTVSGEPLIEVEIGGVFVPWKQGISNWSTISAVTGSPTTGTYTDANNVTWKWYRWTSSGSVTLAAGIIDTFLISGGGGWDSGFSVPGGGGSYRAGLAQITGGTHSVTVGAGGPSNPYAWGNFGRASSIGSVATTVSTGSLMGAGDTNANTSVAIASSITGSVASYGATYNQTSTTGLGDGARTNTSGAAGVVIIRVPSTFALA